MAQNSLVTQSILAGYLALASALPLAAPAQADSGLPCGLLLQSAASGVSSPHRLQVVKTQKLYRTQQKPYALVPEGVAIWVRAPEGVTAADLHRRLSECTKRSDGAGTPICVPGARISVDREHSFYVVHVKSDVWSSAVEIQRRAAQLK